MAVAGTILACCRQLAATSCGRATKSIKALRRSRTTQFEQAIEHFKEAVALDPSLKNAKLYLATAYTAQYIPGVDSPDNVQVANLAIEQYKAVLEQDPAT